ncbi:MAG TPA: hypothetical protein VFK90_13435 [Anaeromyxobacter sp.]|nr:hypothetical protein [Anaeromyxobacter sp.]
MARTNRKNQTLRIATRTTLTALLAVVLAACGGAGTSGSAKIGPQGGTVTTQSGFRLSVPAGALSSEVQIDVHEVAPGDGATRRFEIQPEHLLLSSKAHISVQEGANDGAMKLVEIENEVEHALENEMENEVEHSREADVDHLCVVELRHQHACAVACDPGFECDDGVCKAHPEDPKTVCDPACAAGFHCEQGACVADPNDAPPPGSGCPPGTELDPSTGLCKAHGGTP